MNNEPNKLQRRQLNPLRFAIVVAVLVVFVLLNKESKGQEIQRVSTVTAQPVAAWTPSFDSAVAEAAKLNQPIMIVFTSKSEWCPWGKRLAKDVLETTTFANWSQDRVVLVEVEYPDDSANLTPAQTRRNEKLIKKYEEYISGYPTVLFLTPNKRVVGRMGYAPEGPLSWITKAQKYVGKLDKIAQHVPFGYFR